MKANRGPHRAPFPACLLMALAVGGCQQTTGDSPSATTTPKESPPAASAEPIATYQGHTLTNAQVMQEFERLPAPSRAYLAAPERKKQFVENIVMNELLYDEGRREGLDRDPEIDRQVNDLRKRLVVQRVMRKYQTPPTIDDDRVKQHYDQNPELYSTTQVRANHILVKNEEDAKQIAAEVKANPSKFAELAKEKSTDTSSARRGGELGMFGQGRMVPEFERVAFRLKPGEVSDPVKTQYGWHIITVSERKEGERKPFDQVKVQIRAALRNEALQNQVQGHMDELKRNANLQIDEDALAKLQPPQPTPTQGQTGGASPMPSPHGHGH